MVENNGTTLDPSVAPNFNGIGTLDPDQWQFFDFANGNENIFNQSSTGKNSFKPLNHTFVRGDQLYGMGELTISTYARVAPNVYLAVQYLLTDYERALPQFYQDLEVPFVALAEIRPKTWRPTKDNCIKMI